MDDQIEKEIKKESYGEKRKFQRLADITHLIPQFKRFYFVQKRRDINKNTHEIIDEFNSGLEAGQVFNPNPSQYAKWRMKWDEQIVSELTAEGHVVVMPKIMSRQLVTVDPEGNNLIPRAEDLMGGTQTLAGKLLNDANAMLEADQEVDEFYTADELIKRRGYVLNVFNHVSKILQGDKMIAIKANAEKRETANFMMDLMKRATAGKLDAATIANLKKSYQPKPVEAEVINVPSS